MYLDSYIDEINQLCENHKVRQLFAFGSVLNNELTARLRTPELLAKA